jgi:hypothetical protein
MAAFEEDCPAAAKVSVLAAYEEESVAVVVDGVTAAFGEALSAAVLLFAIAASVEEYTVGAQKAAQLAAADSVAPVRVDVAAGEVGKV